MSGQEMPTFADWLKTMRGREVKPIKHSHVLGLGVYRRELEVQTTVK